MPVGAGHLPHGGAGKNQRADQGRNRIAGQAKDRHALPHGQSQRAPRFQRDAPFLQGAALAQQRRDMIFVPRRCAPAGEDHIHLRRSRIQPGTQSVAIIHHAPKIHRHESHLPQQRQQHWPVGIIYLPRCGRLANLAELIPG